MLMLLVWNAVVPYAYEKGRLTILKNVCFPTDDPNTRSKRIFSNISLNVEDYICPFTQLPLQQQYDSIIDTIYTACESRTSQPKSKFFWCTYHKNYQPCNENSGYYIHYSFTTDQGQRSSSTRNTFHTIHQ